MIKPQSPRSELHSIGRLLGSGGMADVYAARLSRPDGPVVVALKRIRSGSISPELIAHFRREAELGSQLRHDNVVHVEAFGEDAQGPWLAMRFIDGGSARALLRAAQGAGEPALPLNIASAIGLDAARGLHYVHQFRDPRGSVAGLVHRDVSTDNILLGYDGRARLADFGIARLSDSTRLTQTGSFKGKLAYAAPELLDGKDATSSSDAFAFAACLFELFTGRYAFAGRTEVETFANLLHGPAPELVLSCPDIPRVIENWVMQAFEKVPKNRPDSLEPIIAALEASAATPQTVSAFMQRFLLPPSEDAYFPAVVEASGGAATRAHPVAQPRPAKRLLTLPRAGAALAVALPALYFLLKWGRFSIEIMPDSREETATPTVEAEQPSQSSSDAGTATAPQR